MAKINVISYDDYVGKSSTSSSSSSNSTKTSGKVISYDDYIGKSPLQSPKQQAVNQAKENYETATKAYNTVLDAKKNIVKNEYNKLGSQAPQSQLKFSTTPSSTFVRNANGTTTIKSQYEKNQEAIQENQKKQNQLINNLKNNTDYQTLTALETPLNNQRLLAKYNYNVAKEDNRTPTLLDKTLGVPYRATLDFFNVDKLNTNDAYVDENNNKMYLPADYQIRQENVRNSYGDDLLGKAARFGTDLGYNLTKIGLSSAINTLTAGAGLPAGSVMYFSDMGIDSFNQAKLDGYDDKSAALYGAINVASEMVTEKFLGGISKHLKLTKGDSSLASGINKALSKVMKNDKLRSVLSNAFSEGAEEFVQEFIENYNKKLVLEKKNLGTATKETILNSEVWGDALYSTLLGMASGGALAGISSPSIDTNNTGVIPDIDKQGNIDIKTYISQLNKAKDNTTNQTKIDNINQALNYLELNEALGNDTINAQTMNQQIEQYAPILEQVSDMLPTNNDTNINTNTNTNIDNNNDVSENTSIYQQFGKNLNNETEVLPGNGNDIMLPKASDNTTVQNNIQENSTIYDNNDPNSQRLQVAPTSNKKINALYDSASKYFNNSEQSLNLVDTMAKVVKDKGYNILFSDKGMTTKNGVINGKIETKNGETTITVNPYSPRAYEFVLVHEITHAIETKSMKNMIMEYAQKNSEFDSALKSLMKIYDTNEITSEVAADISGQLLGNQEFINQLSMTKPNLFMHLYNEIKALYHKLRGWKSENEFVEDLMNKWEYAYATRNNKNNVDTNTHYYIENVASYSELEYNSIKQEKLAKSEFANLSSIINSDTTIQPGRNIIENVYDYNTKQYKDYEIYYKSSGEFKVVKSKLSEGDTNAQYSRNDATGNEISRIRQSDNELGKNVAQNTTTNGTNAEISNFNTNNAYTEGTNNSKNRQNSREELDNSSFSLKQKQNDIIQKNNPINPELGEHTWINSADDIKTFQEALKYDDYDNSNLTPDFTNKMVDKALETGKITVYSSYPIKDGTFVTPSKMEAQSYAGSNQVYSKTVSLQDVAWIDSLQGQYAKVQSNNINVLTDDGITMTYVRNPNANTQYYGETYGQNLEPAGQYMNMDTMQGKNKIAGLEYGEITFKKPLVIDETDTTAKGWKKILSDKYNGLTGEKLSQAIVKDGYDAVMTRDSNGNIWEVVNLKDINNKNNNSKIQYSKNAIEWQSYLEENHKSKGTITLNKDNDGRTLTKKQQDYFKDSKIRDNNGHLITVYHTTTGETAQFNEFNPVGTQYYRFGDDIVNYYTNSKNMSGSYASQDYKQADTKKITSIKDVNDYLRVNTLQTDNRFRIEENNGKYQLLEEKAITKDAKNFMNKLSENEMQQMRDNIYYDEEMAGTPYEKVFSWDKFDKELQTKYNAALDKYMGTADLVDMQIEMMRYLDNPQALVTNDAFNGEIIKTYNTKEEMYKNIKTDIQKSNWSKNSKIQYEGYLDIKNPYVVDAEERNWNQVVQQSNDFIDELESRVPQDIKDNLARLYQESANKSAEARESYNAYQKIIEDLDNERLTLPNIDDDIRKMNHVIKRVGIDDITLISEDSTASIDVSGWYALADVLKLEGVIGDATASFIIDEFRVPNNVREWITENLNKEINYKGVKNLKQLYEDNREAYNTFDKYRLPQDYFIEKISTQDDPVDLGNELNDMFEQRAEIMGADAVGEEIAQAASVNFSKPELIRLWGTSKTTNDIVKEVLASNKDGKTNYDGVVIKNVYDYGGRSNGETTANDVYVTFNSNQFKAFDNTSPTNDADIRYSKNTKTWQQYLEENYTSRGTKTYGKDVLYNDTTKNKGSDTYTVKSVLDNAEKQTVAKGNDVLKVETKQDNTRLSKNEQAELEALQAVRDGGFATDTDMERIDYLENKRDNLIKYPELKQKVEFKDISKEYTKFKNDLGNFDPTLLNEAESNVKGYRNTKTKAQWLDIAEQIGANFKGTGQELTNYAIQSWFEAQPNQKKSLNREGKGYVKFNVDEWVNAVYKGAGVGEKITNRTSVATPKVETTVKAEETTKKGNDILKYDQDKSWLYERSKNAFFDSNGNDINANNDTQISPNEGLEAIAKNTTKNRNDTTNYGKYTAKEISNMFQFSDNENRVLALPDDVGERLATKTTMTAQEVGNLQNIIDTAYNTIDNGNTLTIQSDYNNKLYNITATKNGDTYVIDDVTSNPKSKLGSIAPKTSQNNNVNEASSDNVLQLENNEIKAPKKGINEIKSEYRETVDNATKTKESKFYKNATETSKFLTEDNRAKLSEIGDLKYYESVTNEEALNKASKRLKEKGTTEAYRWLQQDTKTSDASDIAEGWILLKNYQDSGDFDSMVVVAKKLRQMGTTAGQAVQAFNIMQRLSPEGMVKYAQSELSEAYDVYAKNKSKAWVDENASRFDLNAEEVGFIVDTMKQIENMEDGRAKNVKLGEIQKMLTDKLPPEKGSGIKAWMRISMLFNPKTQIRNVLGNAVITPVNMVGDYFASKADALIAKKTGVRTTGTTDIKSYAKGFKQGLFNSYDDFKRGINTRNIDGNRFELGQAKSFNDNNSIGKFFNKVDNLNSFLLDAGDRGFYEASFTNSINNQLALNNTTKVTQDMIDIATSEALQRTWQDNNNYTKFVLTTRNMLNKVNVKGYGLGDVLIPFAKTPANLTKAIVDYSPAGMVNAIIQAKNLKNNISTGTNTAMQQHQFVQTLGKATAGTMLYVAAYGLAKAGIATGKSDDDKDTRDFLKNTLGVNSYSIKIGDKSFTYDWAQPVAAPLSIMTNVVNSKNNKGQALGEAIVSSLDSAGSILLEQSFLKSINEVLTDNDGIVSGIENAILDLPARAIPTFSKQIVDMTDSTQRQTFEYGQPVKTAINKLKAKIPGVSYTLAPSVDTMGREIQKYGGKNNIFNVFLNPANVNTSNISEAAEEIYKVYKETGDNTIMPRVAPYYINSKGEKTILNTEQRKDFQKIAGSIIEDSVNELKKNSNYKSMSYEDKSAAIKNIIDYAYNKARKEVLDMEMSNTYNKVNEWLDKGGSVASYYADKEEVNYSLQNPTKYNAIKSMSIDYDDYKTYQEKVNEIKNKYSGTANANLRKQKVAEYINSLSLSANKKIMLFKMLGNYSIKNYSGTIQKYINSFDLTAKEKQEIWNTLF